MSTTALTYPATITKGNDGRYLVQFPDVPEALTDGADKAEALIEAQDALSEALAMRIKLKEDVPEPSNRRGAMTSIPVHIKLAPKVMLYKSTRARNISNQALASKLNVSENAVRRLLDPYHESKGDNLTRALAVFNITPVVHFRMDAGAHGLKMSTAVAKKRVGFKKRAAKRRVSN